MAKTSFGSHVDFILFAINAVFSILNVVYAVAGTF